MIGSSTDCRTVVVVQLVGYVEIDRSFGFRSVEKVGLLWCMVL